jgi:hypothetical protein
MNNRWKRPPDCFHTNLDRIVETNITEQSLSHTKDFLHLTARADSLAEFNELMNLAVAVR